MCKSSALAVLRPGGTERPEHRSGILVDHSKEGGRAFVRYSPARFPVLHGIKAQAVSIGKGRLGKAELSTDSLEVDRVRNMDRVPGTSTVHELFDFAQAMF